MMPLTDHARSASRHVRTAVALMLHVRNWREVCFSWSHTRDTGPPLVFRRGFVIQGGAHERPLQGFDSVFRDHHYGRHLKEPDVGVLVDIGANIGALSLDWLSRKSGVKVHAYEPSPWAFEVLKRNVIANGFCERAQLHNEGVWRGSGTFELRRVSSTATTAFASSASSGETFSAKTVGLDEVVGRCAQADTVALVKIDTEGAEAEILEGASNATLTRIEQLVIEYHDFRVPGSLSRCKKVLANHGFQCIVRPTGGAVGLLYAFRRAV
jgi:FkbM family methyltransferase